MGTEELTQIVETIKTLNLNLDSQSAIEIMEIVKPLLWFQLIKGLVINLLGVVAFVVAIYFISKAVMAYTKERE